jgi:hypothetical protein
MAAKKIVVKQDPEAEVPTEVLADAIVAIAEGVRKLRSGRLQDRTLCMLIADAAPGYGAYPRKTVSLRDVKAVLDGIEALERTHLKPKPKA